jgi:hypothetical protein
LDNGWIEGARLCRYDESDLYSPKNAYLLPSVKNILLGLDRYQGNSLSTTKKNEAKEMLRKGVLRVMIAEKYRMTLRAVQLLEDNPIE